ncbi:MAG: hypothetical protein QUV07_07310 [Cyanobium sp. CZS 25K]|nr:hypothetical protein [Cyanobium sp. CZS25K]
MPFRPALTDGGMGLHPGFQHGPEAFIGEAKQQGGLAAAVVDGGPPSEQHPRGRAGKATAGHSTHQGDHDQAQQGFDGDDATVLLEP